MDRTAVVKAWFVRLARLTAWPLVRPPPGRNMLGRWFEWLRELSSSLACSATTDRAAAAAAFAAGELLFI